MKRQSNSRTRIRSCALLLTAVLSFAAAIPAYAEGDNPGAAAAAPLSSGTAPSIGNVQLNDSASVELIDVMMQPDATNPAISFTVHVDNGGTSDLLFMDYWVRLRTKDGGEIQVHTLPQDRNKNRIAAKSQQDIHFYAVPEQAVDLHDLTFEFIQWDFSEPGFERVLARLSVPGSYPTVIPEGGEETVQVDGISMKLSVKKLHMARNAKNSSPAIVLRLENAGNGNLKVPAYEYKFRTRDGLMYPLQAKQAQGLSIAPQEAKELELTGSIPASVNADDGELLIGLAIPEPGIIMPIGDLKLPAAAPPSGELGESFAFHNEAGSYTVQLAGVSRVPWDGQDIVNAAVKLTNQGGDTLPVPDMTAYFLFDDSVKVDAKLVNGSQAIGIGADSAIEFQAIGKIPYTYRYSQAKLVLQEKASDTPSADTLEIAVPIGIQSVPLAAAGSSYTREAEGRRARYSIAAVNTYSGPSGRLISAELEVSNLEKRAADMAPLAARFLAKDGAVFLAQVSEVRQPIGPDGKALFHVWAELPEGCSADDMQIIVGDAVAMAADSDSEGESKPDAYASPVAFEMPSEKSDVQPSLKQIELFPYMISLSRINTSIHTGKLYLKFDYEITRTGHIETDMAGHRLVLVFEDHSGNQSFERSYDLKDWEAEDDGKASESGNDNALRPGKKQQFTIEVSDEDLIYKTEFLKQYSLSVYDEFQGHRKLLGKQNADWFAVSE
ncbi:hypothetical protein [Paenibacillus doosanensis]|uniref:hypothetical protein n=1 Tax=Paenibacillus doosanensis TaxID=1229154 RepID=UPI002180345C|nr:hypothetical protein [Paenibacillus doosanensis]